MTSGDRVKERVCDNGFEYDRRVRDDTVRSGMDSEGRAGEECRTRSSRRRGEIGREESGVVEEGGEGRGNSDDLA